MPKPVSSAAADAIAWLLEGDDPSVRLFTLTDLLGVSPDGDDERLRRGCEAILRDAQDRESGGFSIDRAKKAGGGLHSRVVPCLTGNMVWSLIRLGMLDDPRVQRGIE